MLRRSMLHRSGHGDLFPTSKSAAHLSQEWVMQRPVPHAPGKGRCYADFTHPEQHSKFSFFSPEVHETRTVPVGAPTPHELHHCVTTRPSAASVAATVAGVNRELHQQHRHAKTNDTPMARANITAKLAAEQHAKTQDFMAHKRGPQSRDPESIQTLEFAPVQDYVVDRMGKLLKIENSNANGYVKEWMPWETKPPAPPPPPPKK